LQAFLPANAIFFAGIGILISVRVIHGFLASPILDTQGPQAARDVGFSFSRDKLIGSMGETFDAIKDVDIVTSLNVSNFSSIDFETYTIITPTTAMMNVIVEIMFEGSHYPCYHAPLVITLHSSFVAIIVTKEVKRVQFSQSMSHIKRYLKKLTGNGDSLDRLGRLTGVDDRAKDVEGKVQDVRADVQDTRGGVQDVGNEVQEVDDRVQGIDNNVCGVNDKPVRPEKL